MDIPLNHCGLALMRERFEHAATLMRIAESARPGSDVAIMARHYALRALDRFFSGVEMTADEMERLKLRWQPDGSDAKNAPGAG